MVVVELVDADGLRVRRELTGRDAPCTRHISGGMRKNGRQVVVKVVSFDTSLSFATASARSRFFFPTKHHQSDDVGDDVDGYRLDGHRAGCEKAKGDVTACDVASRVLLCQKATFFGAFFALLIFFQFFCKTRFSTMFRTRRMCHLRDNSYFSIRNRMRSRLHSFDTNFRAFFRALCV